MGDETGTERTPGTKLIAAGEARTAVLRRTYAASVEDLWDAIIDPARLRSSRRRAATSGVDRAHRSFGGCQGVGAAR